MKHERERDVAGAREDGIDEKQRYLRSKIMSIARTSYSSRIDKTSRCYRIELYAAIAAAAAAVCYAPFERIQRQHNYWVFRTLSNCCVSFCRMANLKAGTAIFHWANVCECECASTTVGVCLSKLTLLAFQIQHMCLVSIVCHLLFSSLRSSSLLFFFLFLFAIGLISHVFCLHFIRSEKFGCVGDNLSICECQQCKKINLYEKNQHGKFSHFCVFYWLVRATRSEHLAHNSTVQLSSVLWVHWITQPHAHTHTHWTMCTQMCQRRLLGSVLFWFRCIGEMAPTTADDDMVDVFTSLSHLSSFATPFTLLCALFPSRSFMHSLSQWIHSFGFTELQMWICDRCKRFECFAVSFDRRTASRWWCRKRMYATMKNWWLRLPNTCSADVRLAGSSSHLCSLHKTEKYENECINTFC